MIATNHAYMLWQFRRELISELKKEHEVILSLPFDEEQHEKPFQEMGVKCIDTPIERRGINPLTDLKLMRHYKQILKDERPDLVITYSIKPNVYAGLICGRMGIPFCANVQGLGTAFQKAGLAQFVTLLYKMAFRKVRTVFFENEGNAEEFQKRHIIPANKQKLLHGAGINLERYPYQSYPENEKIHFLYLGRIMQEKGIDELFAAVRSLHAERKDFVLDIVGFYEDDYKEQVESLVKEGIAVFHGFQLREIVFRLIARMILDLVLPDKSERADTAQDSQNQKLGQRQDQHHSHHNLENLFYPAAILCFCHFAQRPFRYFSAMAISAVAFCLPSETETKILPRSPALTTARARPW